MKQEYICQSCNTVFLAYPSTRRGKTVACSVECAGKLREVTGIGRNNNNFRSGQTIFKSLCDCGEEKDYRSLKCFGCRARVPMDGYSKDIISIQAATAVSKSYKEVAKLCGLSREHAKQIISKNNLDISHFKICSKRRTPEDQIFKIHNKRQNALVRKYLLDYDIIDYVCSFCNLIDFWNHRPLTLQLDHINGNPFDNRLENLRFLCPNCHTQTATYCGRNKREHT